MKKTIKAYVERGNDGTYGVYFTDDLGCGFFGDGMTKKEAIEDFIASYEDFKEQPELNKMLKDIEFDFTIDIKSYLEYYSQFFSLEGLSKLTNVNPSQLSQYLNGFRNPSKRTADKIEKGLIEFANDLEGLRA